jgi:hypothetical protein
VEAGGSNVATKRGKSLNKTGLVVIDENEDIADIDNFYFLNQKQKHGLQPKENNFGKKSKQQRLEHEFQQRDVISGGGNIEDSQLEEEEDDSYEEVEKSKTTNLTDLLYQMKKGKGQQQQHQREEEEDESFV